MSSFFFYPKKQHLSGVLGAGRPFHSLRSGQALLRSIGTTSLRAKTATTKANARFFPFGKLRVRMTSLRRAKFKALG